MLPHDSLPLRDLRVVDLTDGAAGTDSKTVIPVRPNAPR